MFHVEFGEVWALYLSSAKVGMKFLVLCMAALGVVMSVFILICVGSALDVKTRFDNQSIGSSTCLMAHDSSSSSDILLSCSLFMNGILRWGLMIGFTLLSMSSWTWQYLCLPIPLKMSWNLALMHWSRLVGFLIFSLETLYLSLVAWGVLCSVCGSWSSSSYISLLCWWVLAGCWRSCAVWICQMLCIYLSMASCYDF